MLGIRVSSQAGKQQCYDVHWIQEQASRVYGQERLASLATAIVLVRSTLLGCLLQPKCGQISSCTSGYSEKLGEESPTPYSERHSTTFPYRIRLVLGLSYWLALSTFRRNWDHEKENAVVEPAPSSRWNGISVLADFCKFHCNQVFRDAG